MNPDRTYNLILIDRTIEDITNNEKNLMGLIYPKNTHMDFNIATALYFASKGEGLLFDENSFDLKILSRNEKFQDNDKNRKTHTKKEGYKNKKKKKETKEESTAIVNKDNHENEVDNHPISSLKMKEYSSTAKIVMSGLGADEIFGGYMRYWVAYRRGGYTELRNEMDFGIAKI